MIKNWKLVFLVSILCLQLFFPLLTYAQNSQVNSVTQENTSSHVEIGLLHSEEEVEQVELEGVYEDLNIELDLKNNEESLDVPLSNISDDIKVSKENGEFKINGEIAEDSLDDASLEETSVEYKLSMNLGDDEASQEFKSLLYDEFNEELNVDILEQENNEPYLIVVNSKNYEKLEDALSFIWDELDDKGYEISSNYTVILEQDEQPEKLEDKLENYNDIEKNEDLYIVQKSGSELYSIIADFSDVEEIKGFVDNQDKTFADLSIRGPGYAVDFDGDYPIYKTAHDHGDETLLVTETDSENSEKLEQLQNFLLDHTDLTLDLTEWQDSPALAVGNFY